jgi:hypothetical protein
MEKEQAQPAWMKLPGVYDKAIDRSEPATLIDEIEGQEPEPPEHMPEPEKDIMRDLYKKDIKDRRKEHNKLKKEETPHVHEGLPYEEEDEEEE